MVEWILKNSHKVPDLLHYLDDFITAGTWDSPICSHYLMTAKEACSRLGLPLHPLKCGLLPSWLSWALELGSNQQVARLPAEKLAATCEQVNQWRARKWCNRLQLKSLIAHLQHAAKEVWPGRTFLRRTIDLSCCFWKRYHPIRINQEFRLDLDWWRTFLSSWNGVSFWLFPGLEPSPDVEVISDASGSLGFGAFSSGAWFFGSWATPQVSLSIADKELFPVVIATRVQGATWHRPHVLFQSDSEPVVHVLNTRSSKVPTLKHLLRDLIMSEARFSFSFSAAHVAGAQNQIADAISRYCWQEYQCLAPHAHLHPTPIPKNFWIAWLHHFGTVLPQPPGPGFSSIYS